MNSRSKLLNELKNLAQLNFSIEAASRLGVRADIIRAWRRQLNQSSKNKDAGTPAQVMADLEEIQKVKKQISVLEKTNYILKKAAAFFLRTV